MQVTRSMRSTLLCVALAGCGIKVCVAAAPGDKTAHTPEQGSLLFFDDFNGPTLDTVHWVAGEHQWGQGTNNNNGVIPQNLSVAQVIDPSNGLPITVLDAKAHGDKYTGPVPGIQKVVSGFDVGNPLAYASPGSYGNGYVRTGGVVWTRLRYGPAKYEVRMRALQQGGGETAIWNYYDPQSLSPGSGDYSEIDIEIPANGSNGSMSVAGLNSYATRIGADSQTDSVACNCLPTSVPNQADGKFHLYEIDWYDGSDGSRPRVLWYLDGVLVQTSITNIPTSPAQLWVGNWPAKWSHNGVWNYDSQDQYIDYVKISKLAGNSYPSSPLPAPKNLTIVTSSNTTVDLAWQDSADSRAVVGYNVLLNGVLIQQTPDTHIELTGLTPGNIFSFTVEAVNTAMIASAPSNAVSVSLLEAAPACKANPTVPVTRLSAKPVKKNGVIGVKLAWDTPASDARDGTLEGTHCSIIGYTISSSSGGTAVQLGGTAYSYTDKTVPPGEYRYDVVPYNQFGTGPGASVTVIVR
jgi:hypothetical protein